MDLLQLPRNGKQDLIFTGELLARVTDSAGSSVDDASATETKGGEAPDDSWEFALYRTSAGAYLLASAYHIVSAGIRSLHTVLSFRDRETLMAFFEDEARNDAPLLRALMAQAVRVDKGFSSRPECAPSVGRSDCIA